MALKQFEATIIYAIIHLAFEQLYFVNEFSLVHFASVSLFFQFAIIFFFIVIIVCHYRAIVVALEFHALPELINHFLIMYLRCVLVSVFL